MSSSAKHIGKTHVFTNKGNNDIITLRAGANETLELQNVNLVGTIDATNGSFLSISGTVCNSTTCGYVDGANNHYRIGVEITNTDATEIDLYELEPTSNDIRRTIAISNMSTTPNNAWDDNYSTAATESNMSAGTQNFHNNVFLTGTDGLPIAQTYRLKYDAGNTNSHTVSVYQYIAADEKRVLWSNNTTAITSYDQTLTHGTDFDTGGFYISSFKSIVPFTATGSGLGEIQTTTVRRPCSQISVVFYDTNETSSVGMKIYSINLIDENGDNINSDWTASQTSGGTSPSAASNALDGNDATYAFAGTSLTNEPEVWWKAVATTQSEYMLSRVISLIYDATDTFFYNIMADDEIIAQVTSSDAVATKRSYDVSFEGSACIIPQTGIYRINALVSGTGTSQFRVCVSTVDGQFYRVGSQFAFDTTQTISALALNMGDKVFVFCDSPVAGDYIATTGNVFKIEAYQTIDKTGYNAGALTSETVRTQNLSILDPTADSTFFHTIPEGTTLNIGKENYGTLTIGNNNEGVIQIASSASNNYVQVDEGNDRVYIKATEAILSSADYSSVNLPIAGVRGITQYIGDTQFSVSPFVATTLIDWSVEFSLGPQAPPSFSASDDSLYIATTGYYRITMNANMDSLSSGNFYCWFMVNKVGSGIVLAQESQSPGADNKIFVTLTTVVYLTDSDVIKARVYNGVTGVTGNCPAGNNKNVLTVELLPYF